MSSGVISKLVSLGKKSCFASKIYYRISLQDMSSSEKIDSKLTNVRLQSSETHEPDAKRAKVTPPPLVRSLSDGQVAQVNKRLAKVTALF